jgi:LytS/YehU family sensor histidine kinase
MLILLIENAVKHGLGAVGAGGWIRARLHAGSDWLELVVENSIAEGVPASPSVRRGGVGLDNLRRRLELLYPGRHQIELDRGADRYRARVRIEP